MQLNRDSAVRMAVVLTALFGMAQPCSAQAPATPADFVGEWSGEGQLFGNPATFSMSWQSVLSDAFLQLDFRNEYGLPDGSRQALTARALYSVTDLSTISGFWFDSRGMVLPLNGSWVGDTLTISWGSDNTERGETTYQLIDASTIEVTDSVLRDGTLVPFATARYAREGEN